MAGMVAASTCAEPVATIVPAGRASVVPVVGPAAPFVAVSAGAVIVQTWISGVVAEAGALAGWD